MTIFSALHSLFATSEVMLDPKIAGGMAAYAKARVVCFIEAQEIIVLFGLSAYYLTLEECKHKLARANNAAPLVEKV